MKLFIQTLVTCPYCGNQTKIYLNAESTESRNRHTNDIESGTTRTGKHKPQTLLCYPDDGGCDRYFVAQLTISANAEIFKIDSN